jgi:hypothetical protein
MSIRKKKFIFNISPTRVVGAITYFDKKKNKAVIEYISQKKINLQKDFSLSDFRKETLLSINAVCDDFILENKVMGDKNILIENADIFLMSPWVEYENYKVFDESLLPFIADYKYLDKLLIKKNIYEDKELVSSDLFSIKANEYEVDLLDLENKKIQKIELSFLDSYVSKFDKHFILGAIKNHFPLLDVKLNSFLPVLLNQIRKVYDPADDFVFLDISSEITEFGVFSNGSISHIMTIPFGINKIINKIIKKRNISAYEAASLLNMFLSQKLNEDDSKIISEIIKTETDLLKKEIKNNFPDNFDEFNLLNVFVVSSAWETNMILKKSAIFNNIHFLTNKLIEEFVDYKTAERDNFIALEAEYTYDFKK